MPAGVEDTGIDALFVFGRKFTPKETSFGEGESGVLKGCAALVDVAVGGPEVLGDAVVFDIVGKRRRELEENGRGIAC